MTSAQILKYFTSLHVEPNEVVEYEVFDEDIDYKNYVDLAQIFFFKMLNPTCRDDSVVLRFKKLDENISFHKADISSEKYGINSEFFNIDKTSKISFLYYYQEALKFVKYQEKQTILNLGVNKGDEFKVIKEMLSESEFKTKKFVGLDYSQSAIDYAKKDMRDENIEFVCSDINELNKNSFARFDLIISIGTLQSSNINFNEKFMEIYQNHLEKNGAIILGFPNCRWIDGEMIYGAKAPNYSFNEMSLVLKDIHFCKKYLQQKKYRVVVTGKDYLFLSARKIV